jgi:acetyltransferase-like isoleucine patch superfamily enzyme
MSHLGERFYTDEELAHVEFRSLGNNVKIKRNANLYFTENMSIGDNSRIDDCAVIVASREQVTIGRNAHIASHCYISASDGFAMEDFCGLSPGVLVFTSSDDYSGARMTNPTLPREFTGVTGGFVRLERHVIIGAGTVILPNVRIEIGTSVGAQSLVTTSLPPWGIYSGVPAKFLRERSKALLDIEQRYLSDGGR